MTLVEGCCNEKTCADSDTYGLRGCSGGCSKDLRSDRGLEIDVVGDAQDMSRISDSLADLFERARHL